MSSSSAWTRIATRPSAFAIIFTTSIAASSGVTGSDEALAPLLGALGVTVHKNERDGEYYNVIHNGTVYLIGPAAELVAVFTGSSHDADAIATDLIRIRRRPGTRPTS